MVKMKDINGQRFGKLKVVERLDNDNKGRAKWLCECDCGKLCTKYGSKLRSGKINSCGCENKKTKHGLSESRLYKTYHKMKQRCNNEKCFDYINYGGRGITVCKEWLDDFMNFYNWSLQNGYKEYLTIDRIDNNGNYEPANCRWVDVKTQSNNRRTNVIVCYKGVTGNITQVAEILNINKDTLWNRLRRKHKTI